MIEPERIVHITNFPVREATDGGSARERALAQFVDGNGGRRLTVQDKSFWLSKTRRIRRISGLLNEIKEAAPTLLIVDYPSYPFFWQHRVTTYFLLSLLFSQLLYRMADRQGFRIAIDVMDLPAFQYADLGFSLSMRPGTLMRFDEFIFKRADVLWVCSGSLAKLIQTTYGVDRSKVILALNGYSEGLPVDEATESNFLRVAYAGSLNPERGIGRLIEDFLQAETASELHICGPSGEWISDRFPDPRVVYHGALEDRQAAATLAQCDLGVIPYPERGYYNLAFATKLAFYIGLGMPVLCSDVTETGDCVRAMGVGMCARMTDFPAAFEYISQHPQQLADWKQQVMRIRGMFSWHSIYTLALEESLRRKPMRCCLGR